MSEVIRLRTRRNQIFGSGAHLFYEEPLHIVRGKGVLLYDNEDNAYVDMYNNVPCIGHSHPHLVSAVSDQVDVLNVHNRYLHESILSYGERLVEKHHAGIQSIVMSCTGTEANEVALMMVKAITEGEGIICTDAAYHGNSTAVRQLTRAKDGPTVKAIPFPETYRCNESDPVDYFLSKVDSQIRAFKDEGTSFAGMLICSLCANEGLPNIPATFMSQATDLVHAAGGLMIADEVQAGLGRAGKWWGYQHSQFVPDIVVMGKPLGAGIPVAATVSSRENVEQFRNGTGYFNTFASSPLQAAAGNAVLDVIEQENLVENARKVGEHLASRLQQINENIQAVGDTRQVGLFVAVEWVKSRESKQPDREGAVRVVNALKSRGFLIGNAGAHGNVLKLRPPLVFNKSHADSFLDAYEEVVQRT